MGLNYSMVGEVTVTITEQDGTTVSTKKYNTVTNFMKNSVSRWLSGVSSTGALPPPTRIAAGNGFPPIGVSGSSATDTALWGTIAGTNKPCDAISITNTYYATYNLQYLSSDYAGAYTELGLMDAAGNLWAHVVLNSYKSNTQTLTVQWSVGIFADSSNVSSRITNYLRTSIVQWLTGTSTTSVVPPTQTRLGTGAGTPQATDTALWTLVAGTTKTCGYVIIVSSYNVQYASTYVSADPNGTFTEAGWFDTNGNMWVHSTVSPGAKAGTNTLAIVGQVGIVGN